MITRWKPYFMVLLIVVYVSCGIGAVNYASDSVTSKYFDMLGTKALDIAKMTVATYKITDAEVAELKVLEFKQILNHPANIRLNHLFSNGEFSDDIKYAYIYIHLEEGEEKYKVPRGSEEYYDAKEGDPLDVLYLVDAIINTNEQREVSKIYDYYDDSNRYTTFRTDWKGAYESGGAVYLISNDEYGDAFTGTLPIYSVEGNYIGNFGVDIYYEDFVSMVQTLNVILSALFVLPSILLSVFYISIYKRRLKIADRDPLTGLYNRRFMDIQMQKNIKQAYNRKRPLTIIMLDVDYFKKYNDAYGHQQGDVALKALSKVALDKVRSRKDIPCRFGGEEGLVILPNANEEAAVESAKKIQRATANLMIEHKENPICPYLTISIGIYSAVPSEDGEVEIKRFIECADKALYTAKASGRNQYQIYREE